MGLEDARVQAHRQATGSGTRGGIAEGIEIEGELTRLVGRTYGQGYLFG